MERLDEIGKYYKPVHCIETCIGILFWVSGILSILSYYWPKQILIIFFIVSVISYSILQIINSLYYFPIAEEERRIQFLSDSLGILLTTEKTKGYYNNPSQPSITRLGVNTLENAFFSKHIIQVMLNRRRFEISGYFIIYLVILVNRGTMLGLIPLITQIIFSYEIISKWAKSEFLLFKTKRTYSDLYNLFLHRNDIASDLTVAQILSLFSFYETSKAFASITLSTLIYNKLNPVLSKKWEDILHQLVLDEID